ECVVKHRRFSSPVEVKPASRNRAATAISSNARGPTNHSFRPVPELMRRHWFVAPRSGSKKLVMSVAPPEDIQGDAGVAEPPRNWSDGSPAPKSKKAPFIVEWPIWM